MGRRETDKIFTIGSKKLEKESKKMSISVQGISKNFKGRRKGESDNQVLKDVSFEIEEGQFVCLLGPSGCGKTTTLTIVAGFQKPTEGIIEVNGNVVTKPGPDRAFMFQNYALFPWLKVGENIEYPMKKMKVPKEERKKKLKELLEMAQLTKYENYYIHEISGGMKQRVLLAQALLGEPRILILDEPTAGLDPKERISIRNYIAELSKNKIILFATHVVSDIECIADKVILLKDGQIIATGTPVELIENMSGKVGEITCSLEQISDKQKKYKIGNIRQRKNGLALRVVGDELPDEAVKVEDNINLEDVYLYYFE